MVQGGTFQSYDGTTLRGEVELLLASRDLMGIKARLSALARLAERFPSWTPWLRVGRGAYNGLRGDHALAFAEFESGLDSIGPGRHPAWSTLAACVLSSLVELGRFDEAETAGERWLDAARRERLGVQLGRVLLALALAKANLGFHDAAVRLVGECLSAYREAGVTGIKVGAAHEAGARIALLARDRESFDEHLAQCARDYRLGTSPGLSARYQALLDDARNLGMTEDAVATVPPRANGAPTEVETLLSTFAGCKGADERALHALRIIVRRSGAAGGYWYVRRDDSFTLAATFDGEAPPLSIDDRIERYITDAWRSSGGAEATQTVPGSAPGAPESPSASAWMTERGHRLQAVAVTKSDADVDVTVAVAVLREDPARRLRIPWPLIRTLGGILAMAGDVG